MALVSEHFKGQEVKQEQGGNLSRLAPGQISLQQL